MRSDIRHVLQTWEHEHRTTLEVLATVPEGRNEQTVVPGKGWTLGGLIWHICISEWWLCADIMGARPGDASAVPSNSGSMTVAEMTAAFQKSHASLLDAISSKGIDWVDEAIDFYGARWTRMELLHLMLRHEAHHRGQLSLLLMVAGGQPPTIYGAPGINLEDAG